MSESRHTPGPWRPGHVDHWERGEKIAVRAEEVDDQPYIAFIPDLLGNAEADARLIAAAPDLLAALNSAPVIRLTFRGPEPYEEFAERYARWHREVKVPAERKATGGDS